jgi:hypothetical protein
MCNVNVAGDSLYSPWKEGYVYTIKIISGRKKQDCNSIDDTSTDSHCGVVKRIWYITFIKFARSNDGFRRERNGCTRK